MRLRARRDLGLLGQYQFVVARQNQCVAFPAMLDDDPALAAQEVRARNPARWLYHSCYSCIGNMIGLGVSSRLHANSLSILE